MKRLRARLRAESGQHATGLTATQLGVLASVVREGPVTAARLATLEHVSAQSIAQSLAVLKAAGLVHGEPDPQDGRKKLMSADPSATELIDKSARGTRLLPGARHRPGRRPGRAARTWRRPSNCWSVSPRPT